MVVEPIEIRFSGSGGQGLQLCAKILSLALNLENLRVAFSQSYEPTSRGGVSRSDLVVDDITPDYPLVTKLDYLVVLDQLSVGISNGLLNKDSVVLADKQLVSEPPKGEFDIHSLPFVEQAIQLGNKRVANIIALGALISIGNIVKFETLVEAVKAGVPPRFLDLNIDAVNTGYRMVTSPGVQLEEIKSS
ncbi:MAG: pyruvate ferredoxin oxidoreductase [bacterium]|nr:pyruvate ferredoxin oxidoreductase [bacterium]